MYTCILCVSSVRSHVPASILIKVRIKYTLHSNRTSFYAQSLFTRLSEGRGLRKKVREEGRKKREKKGDLKKKVGREREKERGENGIEKGT